MNRNTAAAKKIREELLDKLGAWCVDCGEDERAKLEFDHVRGRSYVPNKLSYRHRMTIYRREAAEGKLQVVCGDCNKERRKTDENGRFVPTASVMDDNNIPF